MRDLARWLPLRAGAGIVASAGRLLADLEEFVFPQRCPACAAPTGPERLLCQRCWDEIPALATELCVRCLAGGREPVGCRRHRGYRARAAWVYEERAALVVHAFKYGERPGLARPLGEAIAAALPRGARPDLVLEVPLHPTRRRERGYNQAALLADVVARRLGAPRIEDALRRTRPTSTQACLGPRARRANLAGAFRAREAGALAGREVLIVDDVMTTGSTLEACLAELRACGARASAAAVAWAQ